MKNNKPVSLLQLADETGFARGSMKKTVTRRGFAPFKLKDTQSSPYYLSAENAHSFREQIEREKSLEISVPVDGRFKNVSLSGVYAIEVPSYEGSSRVKIGWSEKIDERLDTYRTIVPDLRVLSVWPTMDAWVERFAIAWSKTQGKQISAELFEFESIDAAIEALSKIIESIGIHALSV